MFPLNFFMRGWIHRYSFLPALPRGWLLWARLVSSLRRSAARPMAAAARASADRLRSTTAFPPASIARFPNPHGLASGSVLASVRTALAVGRFRHRAAWTTGRRLAFFLSLRYHPFDGAWVDLNLELLSGLLGQLGKRQLGLGGAFLPQECQHRSGQLVGAARSRLLWNQASQTAALQGGLGLIKGRPGETRFLGGLADGGLLDLHTPQHLVFHLNQILWIEKATVLKQGSGNGLGVRMQNTLFAEEAAFGVFAGVHM